jgi:hypothetical protein
MSSPICRHKFRESRLAPSFNDERNWELGLGRVRASAPRNATSERAAWLPGGWWLERQETTHRLPACSSRQTCMQQCDLPFSSPRRCLCFVSHHTSYPPHSLTTTLYTVGNPHTTNASRLLSAKNINIAIDQHVVPRWYV